MAKSSMTSKAAARIQSSAAKNQTSRSTTTGFSQRAQSASAKNQAIGRPGNSGKSSGGNQQ